MRTIPYPALVDHSPSLSLQLCRVQIRERHASPRHPILFGPIDLSGAPVSLVLVRNGHSARGRCIPRWESGYALVQTREHGTAMFQAEMGELERGLSQSSATSSARQREPRYTPS